MFIVVFLSKMRLFVCNSPCFLGLKIGAECCVLPLRQRHVDQAGGGVSLEGDCPRLTTVNKRRILLNLHISLPPFNLFNILLTLVSVSTRLLSILFEVAAFSLIFH